MKNNKIKDDKVKDDKMSRKWKLVLLILLISTIGTFMPPVMSQWIFKDSTSLVILTGNNFITLIGLVVSAYFGFNVWQKKVIENWDKKNRDKNDNTKKKLTGDSGVKNEEGEA